MSRDIFEEKLEKMIARRRQESEREFYRRIGELADIVQESISERVYEIHEDFSKTLKSCKDCAKTYDATDNLRKHIFSSESCKRLGKNIYIKTIDCTWNNNYGTFCNKIEDIFRSQGLKTERGFVYIFWTAEPLKYLYVGKTESGIERLKNNKHASVVRSIETSKATRLTIIYPDRRNINNVEASLIKTINDLEYNVKEEHVDESDNDISQGLLDLEHFFSQLHNECKLAFKSNKEENSSTKKVSDKKYIGRTLADANIKNGEKLFFYGKAGSHKDDKTVKVIDATRNMVSLEDGNPPMSISAAAKKLLGKKPEDHGVWGIAYFKYEGRRITDILGLKRSR